MYDGTGDFLDWARGVQLQADIHGWTPTQAGEAARMRLVDAAAHQLIVQKLNKGPVTLQALVASLRPFFPSKHTNSLDALLAIKIKDGEHVRDFAKRLEDALLHHTCNFEDETRLDMFTRGLKGRLSQEAINTIRENTTSIKDAVERAVTRLESNEDAKTCKDDRRKNDNRRTSDKPRRQPPNHNEYCDFHERSGHSTEDCRARKDASISDTETLCEEDEDESSQQRTDNVTRCDYWKRPELDHSGDSDAEEEV